MIGRWKSTIRSGRRLPWPNRAGEWRALVQPEERVGRFDVHLGEQCGDGSVFDDDHDVLQPAPELARD